MDYHIVIINILMLKQHDFILVHFFFLHMVSQVMKLICEQTCMCVSVCVYV